MNQPWKNLSVQECTSAIIDYRGKTPTKTNVGVPLITAKVVKGGRIESPNEFIAEADYVEWMRRGMPKPKDVLITTEAPLGEVAQLGDERVALAQRLIALRGKPGVLESDFLKYALLSEGVQAQLRSRASGTTVLGIKQSELRKVLIPIPPLDEQKRIAHILGALDDKIELNRRMSATLEEMARALFKSWFIDFDPVHAKAEGRPTDLPPEIEALFPESFEDSELGPIPRGWSTSSFTQAVNIAGGGTPKTSVPEYWGGEIPWYSVVDVPSPGQVWVIDTAKQITNEGVKASSTSVLPHGTTIISARGTVGKLALTGVPMAMNQSCYALTDSDNGKGYFTYFLTQTLVSQLQSRTHGSVFDTITRDTLAGVTISSGGQKIKRGFEEVVHPIMMRLLTCTKESQTLAAVRDAILPRLISGAHPTGNSEVSI